MNKIIVYRTHIEIQDYNLGDCPQIEKTFSIYDMTYHKRFPKARIYDEKRKVLMLPRGIDIGYMERIFCSEPVVDTSMDPAGDIGEVKLKYIPRDEIQQEAIKFMINVGKYYHYDTATMKSVNLNTGKGKTYCSVATAAYLGLRSIVITDNIEWLNQWKGFFCEYTDIQPEEVYLISGAPSLVKLYKRDISKYKVLLATHSTLKSIGDKQGWDKISEFFKYAQIGIKFFDEAHLNFDNMFQIDCYTNTFITYYITATPGRSDQSENNIFKLYFKNVPSISLFDQENDPHTKYAAIRFSSNPTPVEASKCKNNYGLNRIAYTDYLVRNNNFHQLLYILTNMALKKPGKHLWYIGTNEAILYIKNWLYDNFPELINQVGIYTSIIPTEKKQRELEKKIILSTTKSAGAAMDIKGLVETVNLAEPFKSRVLAQQTFGRTRDRDTLYKDIVDNGFYYTKRFYEFKKPVFSKYATECVEINMTQDQINNKVEAIKKEREMLIQPIIFEERE